MKYLQFRITDYKGIDDAVIDLSPAGGGIFTLIGLNESGKTTVLEAIANFGINDEPTEVLFSEFNKSKVRLRFIPKHKKANFTGDIKITAKVQYDKGEKAALIRTFELTHNVKLKADSIPDVIEYTRRYSYVDSDYQTLGNSITLGAQVKREAGTFEPIGADHALWGPLTSAIRNKFPRVVYFPTFLFAFPERIHLNPGDSEEPVNAIYRKVIEDIAGALPSPVDVQRHIVERMLSEPSGGASVSFADSDKQQAVLSTLEQMSYHVSQTIFSQWQEILGKKYKKREVVLRPIVDRSDGKSDVYLQFSLREGGSIFDIGERSLGFRWFFSFLLFTHYRARANLRGSTLFLLDEPASNLHPKAQMQLMSSFAKIADGGNEIIYSTHSHYMVNPKWLEQAFIVSNTAIENAESEDFGDLMDNPPRITLERYRAFVGQNSGKVTYFQPVLDRLEFCPSSFDMTQSSILVEGKGDYIILQYIKDILLKDLGAPSFLPTSGATTMGDIVGLLLGWGVPFYILLDDDKEGRIAKSKYINDWGLSEKTVSTFRDIDPMMDGASIEGLIDENDLDLVRQHFSVTGVPTKSQTRLFFSEMLAAGTAVELSEIAKTRVNAILTIVRKALHKV